MVKRMGKQKGCEDLGLNGFSIVKLVIFFNVLLFIPNAF